MLEYLTASQFRVSAVLAAVILGTLLGAVAYCIYFERKIAAWTQDRLGPNRVGFFGLFGNFHFWGLGQPLADGAKFLLKEDVLPHHVDKPLFILAPGVIFLVGFIGFAAIPWGGSWTIGESTFNIQVANPDIGVLYLLGVASMGIYGIVLGGWASNNKYSLHGAIRATAQMLSYEIPMGLCIVVIVLTMGTLRLEEITLQQAGTWMGIVPKWNCFLHPLPFIILFITMMAEANRTPFDMAEAEQELVGGYHTEYSALKFGMFFLAEYAHMITSGALLSVLFLGGWHLPWLSWTQAESTSLMGVLCKVAVMSGKTAFFIFVMMWLRWTLPRFRYDQLMRLAWKGLIPITLALFVLATMLLYWGQQRSIWATVGNVFILVMTLVIAGRSKVAVTGRESNMPPIRKVTA